MTDRTRRTTRPNLVTLESRVTPALAFALAGSNLLSFDTAFPSVTKSVAITNVTAGETLQAIDIRPQNGHLYGLATNATGGVHLYDISVRTGKATPLSAAAVTHTDAASNPVAIAGTRFEIDFNPTVDRVRVVTDAGVNFRMNPNNGTLVDSDANAATGINADGSLTLNAVAATGGGTAYTNGFINAAATTQYTIDATTKQLTIQNPPNNGVLTKAVSISTDGVNPVNFTAVGGFDIPTNISVAASNDIAAGNGFAVLTVGGKASLYTINLTTGLATAVNTVGDGATAITGFALGQDLTNGLGVFSLDGLTLTRFQRLLPAGSKSVAVTGVLASETLVGFDVRPATGQFVGVGFDSAANTGTVYLIDPQTGAATPLVAGTQSGVSFTGVDLIDEAYGIDFNPTVDRIRVVSASGFNFRLNPTTGLAVDSDANGANGNTPDAKINGPATGITGTAYTNSFGGATSTTQYGIDPATDSIYIQTPPNSGTQTAAVPVTLGGAPLNFTAVGGFDISPRVGAPASVAQTANNAYVGLTVGGVAGLYFVDLATGVATAQTGPAGVNFGSLAIADPLFNQGIPLYAAGTGAGVANSVVVYNPDGSTRFTIQPFEATFTGGVYVATGDVTGDGFEDIVVGAGTGGGPVVKVYSGTTGTEVAAYFAYEQSFRGGVTVAVGDTNGDGVSEVVTGTGFGGGPRVRVLSGNGQTEFANYFAYEDTFRGGVLVAAGDINGDFVADVITGTGVGGGPRVRAFSGNSKTELANFFAFEDTFRGGVFVATGNVAGLVTGTLPVQIIAGTGVGGGPRVAVFDATATSLASFFAFDPNNRGGVTVGGVDRNGDGIAEIVVGSGTGLANRIRVVSPANATILESSPFGAGFLGGINVG